MSSIKVTFSSGDDAPIGVIDFNEDMMLLVGLDKVNEFCFDCRNLFNEMGSPLTFKVEYIYKDE